MSRIVVFWKGFRSLALKVALDWFILALFCMVIIASIWPSPEIQKGYFSLRSVTGYGVSLIFFFYGLRLSPRKLREGLSNWRLHTVIQLSTFILFPAGIMENWKI